KVDQRRQVDIRDAVTISHAERFAWQQMRRNPLQSPTGHRLRAGVDERNAPWRQVLGAEIVDTILCDVDDDIGAVQDVVREIFLDDVALVAEADDEIVQAVKRIVLHDVPKNRMRSDLAHRLWLELGLLGETRAHPAGKDHDFHDTTILSSSGARDSCAQYSCGHGNEIVK